MDLCLEAASLSGGLSHADITSLRLSDPQAGKGWDLFLHYSWGAQAERMGRQRGEATVKARHLPRLWHQLGERPCRQRCCPLEWMLPSWGADVPPLKQAACPPPHLTPHPDNPDLSPLPPAPPPTPAFAACGMRKDGAAQPGPAWEVRPTGASANSG